MVMIRNSKKKLKTTNNSVIIVEEGLCPRYTSSAEEKNPHFVFGYSAAINSELLQNYICERSQIEKLQIPPVDQTMVL